MKFKQKTTAATVYTLMVVLWLLAGFSLWLVFDNVIATIAWLAGTFMWPQKRAIEKAEAML